MFALVNFLIWLISLALSIYGVYLGFKAHPILGIALIFLSPVALVFGAVHLITGLDLADETVKLVRSLS
jgi:hypothetical protein